MFKSTLYYFLIKKYKSKILSILFNLILIIIITLLYNDIVEYMAINELKQEVLYIMLSKWFIYIFSSYKIYSNIKSLFIGDNEDDKAYEQQLLSNEQYLDDVIEKKINSMYENIKDKPILKSKKESIYNKYQTNS